MFGNPTTAQAHVQLLLPDLMTFDTSSSKGFLNGRQLTDDVIDAELTLLSNGAVTSDGVVNDSVFSAKFPYLGSPNPKQVTIRSMKVAAQSVSGTPGPPVSVSPRSTFQGTKMPLSGVGTGSGGNASATVGASSTLGIGTESKPGGSKAIMGAGIGIGGGAGSLPATSSPGQGTANSQTVTQSSTGGSQAGSSTTQSASAKPKSKTARPKSKTGEEKPRASEPKTAEPKSNP